MNRFQEQETLPKPIVNVTRWCDKLESKLAQSLETLEFIYVYQKTKNKDLSVFIETY